MDDFPLTADSSVRPNIPRGQTFDINLDNSVVFPGTHRKINVYVPAQYSADTPACVYIGLDGLSYHADVVFDNLIATKEMPITIAIGVHPGEVASASATNNPRFNRSFEFDSLCDSLSRFILSEVVPAVERLKTLTGEPICLSRNPNDWCAGGGSTGGIAAFTLAFHRPNLVRRVFTSIGTFVDMRGGDHYASLIRKTEPMPVRVYMQDGANDQWNGGPEMGDWWMSNQTVERALRFAGYSVQHVWGNGHHDGAHVTQIFPDAMRWLWKDWPAPVTAGESDNTFLRETLLPGRSWTPANEQDSAPVEIANAAVKADTTSQIVAPGGSVYFATKDGMICLKKATGEQIKLDQGLYGPAVVAPTPDGLWLAVLERDTRNGFSYRIKADGSVDRKQRFYRLEVPDDTNGSGASSIAFDRDGRLYVGTHLGVQILDRNGRVRAVLPVPGGAVNDLWFGGDDCKTLFVRCGATLSKRSMRTTGAPPSAKPITLPPGGAG